MEGRACSSHHTHWEAAGVHGKCLTPPRESVKSVSPRGYWVAGASGWLQGSVGRLCISHLTQGDLQAVGGREPGEPW